MNAQAIHISSLERRLGCPGSLAAEEGLPEKDSDMADSGRKVHNALRLYCGSTISDTQDVITLCKLDERETIVFSWFINRAETTMNAEEVTDRQAELELPDTGDWIVGTADLVGRAGPDKMIVWDWKTGWGRQIVATKNLQLRGYIVKVSDMFGCANIDGHLFACGNQAEDMAFTSVSFGPDDIIAARREINSIRDKCFVNNAKRIPGGEQCKWCLAAGNESHCPESCEWQSAESDLLVIQDPITRAMAPRCADILSTVEAFEKSAKAFKAMLKDKLMREPDSIPGLGLKPGNDIRNIIDATRAFEIGAAEGWFTQESFVSEAITVKVGKIEKLAKAELKGKVKAKDIKDLVNTKLAEVIEVKTNAPSITRVSQE